MSDMKKILLTGVTSSIGIHILKLLLSDRSIKISVLLRGANEEEAKGRLEALCKRFNNYDKDFERWEKIEIVLGDLTKIHCGVKPERYKHLKDSITEIYHCAALTNFNESLKNVRRVNVEGTKNILELAKNCKTFEKVNYISSVFISGSFAGFFNEDNRDVGQSFNNYYEQSKFEAELLLEEYVTKGLTVVIYRLSVVTGELNGQMTHLHGLFHQFIRLLTLQVFDRLPIARNCKINLIPCDIAATAIYTLSNNYDQSKIYHIISKKSISLQRLVKLISKYLECNVPECTAAEEFDLNRLDAVHKKILIPFLPYFNSQVILTSDKTIRELEKFDFQFPEINRQYIVKILEFGKRLGYFKSLSREIKDKIILDGRK